MEEDKVYDDLLDADWRRGSPNGTRRDPEIGNENYTRFYGETNGADVYLTSQE